MKEEIDNTKLPKHIAVIMDGNGRWAQQQGAARVFGHNSAIKAVREITEGCAELGIGYLTLYAFSTENWNRPKLEVEALMYLLVKTIAGELPTLQKNNIRLSTIGDTASLPNNCQKELYAAIENTKNNSGLNLILALGYSGKWDILQATKRLANEVLEGKIQSSDITEERINQYLATEGRPDVDLMLRTGGDYRISNFLLWQLAYAELYIFDQLFWPDFRKPHLYEAILTYQNRERRFGLTGEQIRESGRGKN